MVRYTPSRTYITAAAVAMGMAAFSAWCAWSWWPAYIPTVLLVASAGVVFWLAARPVVEVDDHCLRIRDRAIPWTSIRRVDQTNWISPMVLDLTTADHLRLRIIYPGDAAHSAHLLETIQKKSRLALLNGIPHAKIYGEPIDQQPPVTRSMPSPRYRLLNEDDEAEVERLYQKLKTAGRLDPDK